MNEEDEPVVYEGHDLYIPLDLGSLAKNANVTRTVDPELYWDVYGQKGPDTHFMFQITQDQTAVEITLSSASPAIKNIYLFREVPADGTWVGYRFRYENNLLVSSAKSQSSVASFTSSVTLGKGKYLLVTETDDFAGPSYHVNITTR